MALVPINGVLPLPTGAAEILEALEVAAKVWTDHAITHGAQRIFQVRVDLNLWKERARDLGQ